MYSQNSEEQIIKDYFGDNTGSCLSLGENDGQTLSNVLSCIQRDWWATLVEPSKTAFYKLIRVHGSNPKVECFQVAIGETAGMMDFYESGTHLGTGDTSLLSTLKESELKRWEGSPNEFTKTRVEVITMEELLRSSKLKTFDLISIDCEGVDFEILQQMDLNDLECKMLIVETNSVEDQKYIDYCSNFGMKVHHKNAENLIFVR